MSGLSKRFQVAGTGKWMNEWMNEESWMRGLQTCPLTIYFKMWTVSSDVSTQRRHRQPLSVHLWAYCTHPTDDVNDVGGNQTARDFFGSIFLCFSFESSRGSRSPGGNLRPPPLNDSLAYRVWEFFNCSLIFQIHLAQCQYTLRLKPIGYDRNNSRYWVFNGPASGVYIEQGWKTMEQQPSGVAHKDSVKASGNNGETEDNDDVAIVEMEEDESKRTENESKGQELR